MPLTGYLKIPDIDGESYNEAIKGNRDFLSDGAIDLLERSGEFAGDDLEFDFKFFKVDFDEGPGKPQPSESFAINFTKITFNYPEDDSSRDPNRDLAALQERYAETDLKIFLYGSEASGYKLTLMDLKVETPGHDDPRDDAFVPVTSFDALDFLA